VIVVVSRIISCCCWLGLLW